MILDIPAWTVTSAFESKPCSGITCAEFEEIICQDKRGGKGGESHSREVSFKFKLELAGYEATAELYTAMDSIGKPKQEVGKESNSFFHTTCETIHSISAVFN